MMDNEQIMRNEQICNAELILQFLKHIDNLRLNGNIQRGYGLIADDEARIHGKCTRDADSLPLTAGKLMRITGGMLSIQTDHFHEVHDFIVAVLFCRVEMMDIQRLTDDILDGHTRIQG